MENLPNRLIARFKSNKPLDCGEKIQLTIAVRDLEYTINKLENIVLEFSDITKKEERNWPSILKDLGI
jgi:hypothetical protein